MPWKEIQVVHQREIFVRACLREEASIAELCRLHRISRKTGYKWLHRFLDGGTPSLMDGSRAPLSHPEAVADGVVSAIVMLKKQRPSWGPKKLREKLMRTQPDTSWPSESTFARILKRHGLVNARRRMRRTPTAEHRLAVAQEPNHIWCADFKGKFRVGGKYCHPLTITDACSRYVLCCHDTGGERTEPTKEAFERTFREFGLPLRIRSDNGTPFASTSLGGLSKLSVWWVKLGILPERTRPGHPQDNGLHERMHRTLKQDTAKPPRSTLEDQRAVFVAWQREFNEERPHEGIGMKVPAEVYRPSSRQMPEEVGDPEYPDHFEVRRVHNNGTITIHKTLVHVAKVLNHEAVGLEPIDDGHWQLWFGPIYLGLLTELGRKRVELTPNRPYAAETNPERRPSARQV